MDTWSVARLRGVDDLICKFAVLQGEPLPYLNTAAHFTMSSLQIRKFNIAMRQARPGGTRPQAVTTIGWSFGMLGHGASWAPPSPRYPTSHGHSIFSFTWQLSCLILWHPLLRWRFTKQRAGLPWPLPSRYRCQLAPPCSFAG